MISCVIADTSCLIALDRIHSLALLQELFSSIVATEEVSAEFGKPLPAWISIQKVNDEAKKKELAAHLDQGEASAIALALETPASVLIMDEKKGRRIAKELNLEILGTLRILGLAKQKGILSSVSQAVSELEKKNLLLMTVPCASWGPFEDVGCRKAACPFS
ncbi:hypothetical protein BH24BAC1_BH24BAC1_26680 [soil metagenome]